MASMGQDSDSFRNNCYWNSRNIDPVNLSRSVGKVKGMKGSWWERQKRRERLENRRERLKRIG